MVKKIIIKKKTTHSKDLSLIDDEFKLLDDGLKDIRHKIILYLGGVAGMRVQEICQCRLSWLSKTTLNNKEVLEINIPNDDKDSRSGKRWNVKNTKATYIDADTGEEIKDDKSRTTYLFEDKYINVVFTWFETNDNFEITRDLRKIKPIFEDEEATLTTFKIALEKLEEMQLLASKDYADKKYYILEKSMDAFQQSVDVGPFTAKYVSTEINEFCNLVEDNSDACQTSNITEKDIRNLVHIVLFYKQRVLEKEQIISSDAAETLLNEFTNPKEEPPSDNKKKKK